MTLQQESKSYMDKYLTSVPGIRRLPSAFAGPVVKAEQRPWGSWSVLYEGEGMKVKLIEVSPGHRLSLQYHRHRSELWICVSGRASAVVGEREIELAPRDTVTIPVGTVHRLGNPGDEPMSIVEVQQGDLLSEEDIVRLEDDYNRAHPRDA